MLEAHVSSLDTLGVVRHIAGWSLAVVAALAACGGTESGSSAPGSSAPGTAAAPTTNTALPCAPLRVDCTPPEVIAAIEDMYTAAGVQAAEAACLAPIAGADVHSVAEALAPRTDAETVAAIECVGSAERLATVDEMLADHLAANPLG